MGGSNQKKTAGQTKNRTRKVSRNDMRQDEKKAGKEMSKV